MRVHAEEQSTKCRTPKATGCGVRWPHPTADDDKRRSTTARTAEARSPRRVSWDAMGVLGLVLRGIAFQLMTLPRNRSTLTPYRLFHSQSYANRMLHRTLNVRLALWPRNDACCAIAVQMVFHPFLGNRSLRFRSREPGVYFRAVSSLTRNSASSASEMPATS
jgi:hypothetical protein